MWTLLREVSLRHLKHSPFRTALVVFGIALGVCMLSAILATNQSLIGAFEDMVDRVAGKADLTVAGSEAGVPSSLTGDIADIEGVEHAAAMLEVTTRTPSGDGGAILVLGVDFLGDTFFLPFAQEGTDGAKSVVEDPLAFVNDPTAILVAKKLAQARGLKEGDTLPLMTSEGPKDFTVKGLLEDEGPAASFGGQVVVMFIDAAQVSFSRGYSVDRIDIVVAKTHQVKDVQADIQALIGGTAKVEEPQGRTQRLVGSLWAFQNALNMTGVVALWVGMFLIYNAVAVSVAQRRREVGVLRALGVTKRKMVALFCLEALVMATIGVAVGLFAAHYLAQFALESVKDSVNKFILPIAPPPPRIDGKVAILGTAAGFVTTLIASFVPAKRTNNVDPAEALRATRTTSTAMRLPNGKLALLGLAIGLATLVPATQRGEAMGYLASTTITVAFALMVPLAIVGMCRLFVKPAESSLGIPGRLAIDNVERSLGRSAITVVALMLAVAMSTTLGAWTRSFEQSLFQWSEDAFPADIVVTAGSPMVDNHNVPFAPEVMDKLQGIDGVLALSPIRVVRQDIGKRRAQLMATDTEIYFEQAYRKNTMRRVLEGPEKLDKDALSKQPSLMISENMSAMGDLHPGDTLELRTPSGLKEFTISAVVVDYSTDQGWAMIDRRWYRDFWQDEQIDQVDVYLTDGSNGEAVASQVRERLGSADTLFVTPNDQLRAEIQSATKSLFTYAKAPELVTLLVAIMGVIGTMLAAVLDRIREVGMLRAIGATRQQVTNSVVVEAGFLGLAAALWGVAAGVPQGLIFVKVVGYAASGWNLPYTFPTETVLRVGLLVVGTAAIAGFLPGRRAAGMDVKEALAYE